MIDAALLDPHKTAPLTPLHGGPRDKKLDEPRLEQARWTGYSLRFDPVGHKAYPSIVTAFITVGSRIAVGQSSYSR